MNDIKQAAAAFLTEFSSVIFPDGFLDNYDQIECLSSGHGTETFLVQSKDNGSLFIAKCYNKQIHRIEKGEGSILRGLSHSGLPHFENEFEDDSTLCVIREYIEGTPLDRYAEENELGIQEAVRICLQLCDILIYLHTREALVIHRDIKPQNIIVRSDGRIALIDFDISRVYDSKAETDTQFFGTRNYAAPEQYGFMQTDARADIFSFGVLLRYLVTGNERKNDNITFYRPIARIIGRCTAFAPEARYQSMADVKKALQKANPRAQRLRTAKIGACVLSALALLTFGGIKLYDYVTFDPFAEGNIPAVMTDADRVSDAVSYLKETYGTDLFDDAENYATVGFVKTVLTDVYGYNYEYVHALPADDGIPHESEENFFPWGMGDEQYVDRDYMVYVTVKVYWPEIVSEENWSTLKDDNGYYPGVRLAVAFAEEHGILTGVGRPLDITMGETAILLANAGRVSTALHAE